MGYRGRYNMYNNCSGDRPGEESCHKEQRHVHELQGSVKLADANDPHTHRFCTVTEEAIPCGDNGHIHEVCFRTDYFEGHYHEFKGKTCPAIPVGDRHVHYIEAVTSVDDGHRHAFEAATLIENPTGKDFRKDCKREEHDEHNPGNWNCGR